MSALILEPLGEAATSDVGRYLYHLVKTEGRAMATTRTCLAGTAAAHRLD